MYSDPTQIRKNVLKTYLSDEEDALITALVNYNGGQKSTLVRDIVIEHAQTVLGLNDTAGTHTMAGLLKVAS